MDASPVRIPESPPPGKNYKPYRSPVKPWRMCKDLVVIYKGWKKIGLVEFIPATRPV